MKKIFKIIFFSFCAVAFSACSSNEPEEGIVIRTLEDMKGRRVTVLGGSVQDLLLSEKCPDSEILRADSDPDCLLMVETGKADAILESSISWKVAKNSYHNIYAYEDNPINPMPLGFGFGKDKKELREKFNLFLKDYLADNDLNAIEDEWADADSQRKMPDSDELTGDKGTLHFAVSAIAPPYDFIKNGEISGMEPEILAKFAQSLDMKWDFVDVAFTGLIPYIQCGKADIGSAIMCITPERQQSIDFSEPWNVESSIILVNKKFAPVQFAEGDTIQKASLFERIKNSFKKSVIDEDRYLLLLEGLKVTVIISLLAALFGTLLGIFFCYTSMRHNKLISGATNIFTSFMGCMPVVVFLMIMFYVVFGKSDISAESVAIIAFSLCFGAGTSVIFRSSVTSIDKGQSEAAVSMGFSKFKAFINIILPQAVQRAMPIYKGEIISLVKNTSVVGYIAVFDLTKAGDIIRSRTFEAFFSLILVTILYFFIIWLFTLLLKFMETKTKPTRKKFFQ